MASKKNFRFSIIMTKQVLVRVRCWLETTTSSVDTVYCAQVRPSSCSTANVDSAPAHVICIVSSLHTAQLCWLPGTHTLTRVLAFTQIAHILGSENVPCPSYLPSVIDTEPYWLPDKWNVNSMFIIWMPPHDPLTDYIISSVLSSDTQASLMKRYVADVHITTPILSLIATAPLFLLFFLASSAFLIFSWRLKDLNLWTVGGVRFLNLHLGLLSLFSTIKVYSCESKTSKMHQGSDQVS